ncbi:hypothetical protein CEUSTIGMA_g4814.t1 [Chlamydomonas eustigma]|uniref:J domain-containing protein n=1 Tax=Chlamydomonas eustigma TaxID=1157962 RepID=A0A250X2S0_9CHLO|nr:hypothetical protein CEUSTIGMA_g4814.t1 [Chlamydomonas eustigma]|eukprot:GAX77368.1 hypothetical protein CEUSTIGMA_g4814.t1 [Chlamydomonas eustigma]
MFFQGRGLHTSCLSSWAFNSSQSNSSDSHDLYAILGVRPGASLADIKRAYRLRARQLHPDVASSTSSSLPSRATSSPSHINSPTSSSSPAWDPSAFIKLSAAYDVLSSRVKRQAYDDSRKHDGKATGARAQSRWKSATGNNHTAAASSNRPSAAAAAAGGKGASGYTQDRDSAWASGPWRQGAQRQQNKERDNTQNGRRHDNSWTTEDRLFSESQGGMVPEAELLTWRYGVGDWMMSLRALPDPAATMTQAERDSLLTRYLRRYQREIQTDLHKAFTHAYLGPSLDYLAPFQLPKHFEAEVRNGLEAGPEVLQLVSGRTLLGTMSLQPAMALLPAPGDPVSEVSTTLPVSNHDCNYGIPHSRLDHPAGGLLGQECHPHNESLSSTLPSSSAAALVSSMDIGSGSSQRTIQELHRSGFEDPEDPEYLDLGLLYQRSMGPSLRPTFDPLRFFDRPDPEQLDLESSLIVRQLLQAHHGEATASDAAAGVDSFSSEGAQGGVASSHLSIGGVKLRGMWREQQPQKHQTHHAASAAGAAVSGADSPCDSTDKHVQPQDSSSREVCTPSMTSSREVCTPSMTSSREVCTPSMTSSREVCTPSMTSSREVCTPSMTSSREVCTPSMTSSREVCTPSMTSQSGDYANPDMQVTEAAYHQCSPSHIMHADGVHGHDGEMLGHSSASWPTAAIVGSRASSSRASSRASSSRASSRASSSRASSRASSSRASSRASSSRASSRASSSRAADYGSTTHQQPSGQTITSPSKGHPSKAASYHTVLPDVPRQFLSTDEVVGRSSSRTAHSSAASMKGASNNPSSWEFDAETEGAEVLYLRLWGQPWAMAVREPINQPLTNSSSVLRGMVPPAAAASTAAAAEGKGVQADVASFASREGARSMKDADFMSDDSPSVRGEAIKKTGAGQSTTAATPGLLNGHHTASEQAGPTGARSDTTCSSDSKPGPTEPHSTKNIHSAILGLVSLQELLRAAGKSFSASTSAALQAVQSLDLFSGLTGVLSSGSGAGGAGGSLRRRVKIYVEGKLVAGLNNDAVLDMQGNRCGYLMRGGSLGVHTIHCFDTTVKKIRLLCRMTRSQALPSSTWLFPPRDLQHSSGSSWYLEWGGYMRKGQPGWLEPSVYCFIIAFASLDFERQLHGLSNLTVTDSNCRSCLTVTAGHALASSGDQKATTTEVRNSTNSASAHDHNHDAVAPADKEDYPRGFDEADKKRVRMKDLCAKSQQAWARARMLMGFW